MSHHHDAARKAEFSERGLAFAADVSLFAAAWVLILKAIDPALPVLHNEKGAMLTVALTGYSSSTRRSSPARGGRAWASPCSACASRTRMASRST